MKHLCLLMRKDDGNVHKGGTLHGYESIVSTGSFCHTCCNKNTKP